MRVSPVQLYSYNGTKIKNLQTNKISAKKYQESSTNINEISNVYYLPFKGIGKLSFAKEALEKLIKYLEAGAQLT